MINLLGWLVLVAMAMVAWLVADHIISKRREEAEIRREKRSGHTPPAGYKFEYDYSAQNARMIQDTSVSLSKMVVTLDKIHTLLKEMHYGGSDKPAEIEEE